MQFGLPGRPAHRARGDVETLVEVFGVLCDRYFATRAAVEGGKGEKGGRGQVTQALDAWLWDEKPSCIQPLLERAAGGLYTRVVFCVGCGVCADYVMDCTGVHMSYPHTRTYI